MNDSFIFIMMKKIAKTTLMLTGPAMGGNSEIKFVLQSKISRDFIPSKPEKIPK